MSLIFMEGWDLYDTNVILGASEFAGRWTYISGSGFSVDKISKLDSFGKPYLSRNFNYGIIRTEFFNPISTNIIVGFWMYPKNGSSTPISSLRIMSVNNLELYLYFNDNTQISIARGSTILKTSPIGVLPLNRWSFVELKAVVAPGSSGSYTLRVDNNVIISDSATNTAEFGGAIDNIRFNFSTARDYDIGDLYVLDDTGSSFNDFLGDIRIETLHPNASKTSQWTAVGGSGSNYLEVDDTPRDDGDTTYVTSSAPTAEDLYGLEDLPVEVNGLIPRAVQVSVRARDENASANTFNLRLEHNTNFTTGIVIDPQISYEFLQEIFVDVPGGVGWSASNVDELNVGIQVT